VRAVVIGAGLAGLVAADEFRRGGAEVIVLEARDRVGGRVWSRRLDNGAVIEMGAEFMLPGNTEVRALAARLGLELWDKGMRYGRREPRGGIGTSQAALDEAMRVVDGALQHVDFDCDPGSRRSVRQLLDSLAIDPAAREVILARAEISAATLADHVPATGLAGLAHIDDQPAPSVAGGNHRLAAGLAAGLGEGLRLSDAVARIEWAPGRLRLETAAGNRFESDVGVIAVPAGVIGQLEFSPPLPNAKREAIAGVRYGHAAKLFVPLTAPAPPGAVMNVPERYWCWTATGAGPEAMPVLSCFCGSYQALERLGVIHGPEAWLDSLEALRPDLTLDPGGAVLSTWDDDPWVGAAYSVFPTPELTAALVEPIGPLAFAGEHAGGPFSGLMEGAIRSGRMVAKEVLRHRLVDR
jgi:monoamine oxidase